MSRPRHWLRVGISVVAAAGLIAAATLTSARVGDDNTVTLTGTFEDANPLVQGNLVKLDGVSVGEITSISLHDGQARVQMELDKSVLPLHDDASLKIRPKTLLGERYIELRRGSEQTPAMQEPYTIPAERTSHNVDLDDLLNSLDDPTSSGLAALLTTLGEGTAGNGKNIDAALKALPPTMRDIERLGTILDEQIGVLTSLIDKVTPVAKAAAGKHGDKLDSLVDSTTTALSAASSNREALRHTLMQLPGTLRQAQTTLAKVAGVSDVATKSLRDARPVTDNLSAISVELQKFADTANPALASMPRVLDRADALLAQAAPLVRDLRPGAKGLRSASRSTDKIVSHLSQEFTTVLDFVKFWALSTNSEDGISNYFRGVVPTTPGSLLQTPGVSTGDGEKAPPQRGPDKPKKLPLPNLGDALPNPDDAVAKQDSATGLDRQQENALLDQLLGGP